MVFSIGLRDCIYCAIVCCIVLSFTHKHKNEKIAIETRLKEVCFRYNDSCDSEIGGCECIAKANDHDVMYILKK